MPFVAEPIVRSKLSEAHSTDLDGVFRGSPYSALKNVTWELHDEALTLRGVVPSQYLKQLAQETAADTVRGRRIINRIVVQSPAR